MALINKNMMIKEKDGFLMLTRLDSKQKLIIQKSRINYIEPRHDGTSYISITEDEFGVNELFTELEMHIFGY
jgi:hypothetical protein